MLSVNRLMENTFLLTTGALSLCAWVIAFGGVCAFRALPNVGYWIIVYELFLTLGILFVFMSGTFLHYRMALLTLLAISIALLHGQIDYVLPIERFDSRFIDQGGAAAVGAGYIIMIIIQFLWVFVFGSEPNSYLGQFGHGWTAMNNSVEHHHVDKAPATTTAAAVAAHPPQQYEMGDKTIVPSPGAYNEYPPNSAATPHPAAASSTTPVSPAGPASYPIQVEALHDYKASPDDPTELSFKKGDILHVVERKGNWWQARNSEGATGIIPSNYFAP
ncbi:hypothetical protein O0I10_009875 [Lichtheimia ornata]|uniref:SH3 domain-containing protein n=1 Tax=Lichtheimia ornata TaxID=688661 RepID=A0AAD7UX42_9FUNG|nr:uncharacterized protein O0I10_009875 [Lichtheimia ornata]KAJ8654434.1 hypothetical protein O0I10_009875 [Lichtheimia ornata]